MNAPVKFSIIIPVKEINGYVRETVSYVLRLNRTDWELLIVPNAEERSEWDDPRISVIASGKVGPGLKRDMAAQTAEGEILVFLDDDSYPKEDLLDVAEKHFADPGVAALGGPALTPPGNGFWQRVSGTVFLSKFSGGAPERYVPVGEPRETDDWPSVNLMVRKADFAAVGGFDSAFWPGEDTKFCLDLIKKTGKKILYVPQMIVWHHRRPSLIAHLKQVGGYGLHRGFFAKTYPGTSLRPAYFVPSGFLAFCLFSLLIPFMPSGLKLLFSAGWLLYVIALMKALLDFMKYEAFPVAFCGLGYVFCTHLVYGARFVQGLVFTRRLVSRLR